MPTTEGFVPEPPLPSFLSADKTEQQDVATVWETAIISSQALNLSILAATTAVIGIAALSLGNPATLFSKVTTSLTDAPALRRGLSQSKPTMQSTTSPQPLQSADAELPALITTGAPARDEGAAAPAPAGRTQTENHEPAPGVMLMRFQAWAARQDTLARVDPGQSPQDYPTPVGEIVLAPAQKQRKAKLAQNPRADIPHIPMPRARLQWGQNARVEGKPVQIARAEDQAVQNAQAPAFLQGLVWHQ
jgi:hypothetical protein